MIRSFVGTSLIEYPGRVASVIFLGGCNLHCPYCHNPELVRPDLLAEQYSLPPDHVLESLRKREGFVDGVTITGGEPLLHPEVVDLIERISRTTSLSIKVDTNGTYPERLEELSGMVDYVALDVKSSRPRYEPATGGMPVYDSVLESIRILTRSFPDYELRTTMVPGIVGSDDLLEIAEDLPGTVRRYALQQFRAQKTLSPEFLSVVPYALSYMRDAADSIRQYAEEVVIR